MDRAFQNRFCYTMKRLQHRKIRDQIEEFREKQDYEMNIGFWSLKLCIILVFSILNPFSLMDFLVLTTKKFRNLE
jgi:hypothetical protein